MLFPWPVYRVIATISAALETMALQSVLDFRKPAVSAISFSITPRDYGLHWLCTYQTLSQFRVDLGRRYTRATNTTPCRTVILIPLIVSTALTTAISTSPRHGGLIFIFRHQVMQRYRPMAEPSRQPPSVLLACASSFVVAHAIASAVTTMAPSAAILARVIPSISVRATIVVHTVVGIR